MKRMHLHLRVDDLKASTRFYTALFGAAPNVLEADYAKWTLEDPRVNLALSQGVAGSAGLDHLGIQAETDAELAQLHERLAEARYSVREQKAAACCYARSDKHWAIDPAGLSWEMFHTLGEITTYGGDRKPRYQDLPPAGAATACGCAGSLSADCC